MESRLCCERIYSARQCQLEPDETISEVMLCAGIREGGIDSCQGDSGGPLTYHNSTSGKTSLVGVVSWGIGCAERTRAGIYARVGHCQVLSWISKHFDDYAKVCNQEYLSYCH